MKIRATENGKNLLAAEIRSLREFLISGVQIVDGKEHIDDEEFAGHAKVVERIWKKNGVDFWQGATEMLAYISNKRSVTREVAEERAFRRGRHNETWSRENLSKAFDQMLRNSIIEEIK